VTSPDAPRPPAPRPPASWDPLGPGLVVAIDGPSGSGKSSVSRQVAARLGLAYLDTGAMYRALAWWCADQGVDLSDTVAVAATARDLPLQMGTDPESPAVLVAGRDIAEAIRTSAISTVVSQVATNLDVRAELVARQRRHVQEAARGAGIVAEGRDITTVVAPDADVRVLLVASEDARLRRRARQLHGDGGLAQVDQMRDEVVRRDRDDSTVATFLQPADGVTLLDTSALDFDESVAAVLALVAAAALRAGLADFELTDEDQALVDGDAPLLGDAAAEGPLPVVAIVGRPNVGKSSLVNRILRRREAVVEDVPGVTRDRVAYEAEWSGRRFTIVDTGGWSVDATGIHLRVAEQAEVAVDLADVVVFVVDAKVGSTDDDEAVVKLLRRAGKPVVLAANKVDDERTEADALALWNLGLGEPHAVSALHGRGSGDLLDAILDVLPEVSAVAATVESGGPRRVALIGRPNVGKSSLLNKLIGTDRVVVDDVAGTTRDPVDELIELGGRVWRFVDTAGIRRRVHQTRGADFYASLRTQTALEKAEVAVVLIDAQESISEQDIRVVQQVIDAGRALVIAYNKVAQLGSALDWGSRGSPLPDGPKQLKIEPRDVAQLGSAPDWGSGGRRFKSCHPDRKALMRSISSGLRRSADGFLLVPLWSPGPMPEHRRRARRSGSKWAGLWIRGPKGDQNRSGLRGFRHPRQQWRRGPVAAGSGRWSWPDRARKALACSAAEARCRSSGCR
jgi:GTP-binding protein